MANNGSYGNERAINADYDLATDPASSGFFNSDYKKHDDLKQMLDSNKDGLKLEAMKRIIGMIAKGRDASELFAAVVKIVVSKNIEVKKLVYVYLVRYAEEQQDLALLSISTFQRALKDPNQLIRASALRVLSSIRVPVIVPIVMLSIKDSASDMSPYVRKTAAHAIPKLYSLDPEQKEELVHVIEKLLSDKTTLVVGSAVMAFEEVCPERIDLIHKNYRKLCNLLVDVDEWGQVIIINMLTRYGRTQFLDPNKDLTDEDEEEAGDRPFYEEEEEEEGGGGEKQSNKKRTKKKTSFSLDPDHRLLLKNSKPLLQSRNAAVVMSVAQLYHHLAPRSEVSAIAKSLIRLLRSHREVQSVVLNSIAAISTKRKGMFEPYLKSFFVRTSDPTHIKLLKLEILTNLATETSISVILREFQTYISSPDKEFVAAAIQAIGRCASNIKEVTDTCLSGLVSMLSNRDEAVVAESVVVIKKLLQSQPNRHRDIIRSMAKLMHSITVPAARASILWLLGEYSELVPTIAPDVLREMAKSFINEEDIVKLQVLNLSVKLYLTNPAQTYLLCQYVFNLARYDQNYDLRDRSRFLKQFIFPTNTENNLSEFAKKIFLATKPAPLLQSKFKDRENYQLGSLTHYINSRANGYHDLPHFPQDAPDPSARSVSEPLPPSPKLPPPGHSKKSSKNNKPFYSESESSPGEEDSESSNGETSNDQEEEDSGNEKDSDSSETDSDSDETDSEDSTPVPEDMKKKVIRDESGTEDTEDDSSSESSDSSEDEESDSSDEPLPRTGRVRKQTSDPTMPPPKSNLDLLLDLDEVVPNLPVLTPSYGGFFSPPNPTLSHLSSSVPGLKVDIQPVSARSTPMKYTEVISRLSGKGLAMEARFTRRPHLFAGNLVSVELAVHNLTQEDMSNIHLSPSKLPFRTLHPFAPVAGLSPLSSATVTMGADFFDSTHRLELTLSWSEDHTADFILTAPMGEQLRAVTVTKQLFDEHQGRLKGMTVNQEKVNYRCSFDDVPRLFCETANLWQLPAYDVNVFRFSGQTISANNLVLVTVSDLATSASDKTLQLTVHCDNVIFCSLLLIELKSVLI